MAEHFLMVADNIFDLLVSSNLDVESTLEEASEVEGKFKIASLEKASRLVSDMKERKVEIERKVERLKRSKMDEKYEAESKCKTKSKKEEYDQKRKRTKVAKRAKDGDSDDEDDTALASRRKKRKTKQRRKMKEDSDSDIEFLDEINSEDFEGFDEKEEKRLAEKCLKEKCFVNIVNLLVH